MWKETGRVDECSCLRLASHKLLEVSKCDFQLNAGMERFFVMQIDFFSASSWSIFSAVVSIDRHNVSFLLSASPKSVQLMNTNPKAFTVKNRCKYTLESSCGLRWIKRPAKNASLPTRKSEVSRARVQQAPDPRNVRARKQFAVKWQSEKRQTAEKWKQRDCY